MNPVRNNEHSRLNYLCARKTKTNTDNSLLSTVFGSCPISYGMNVRKIFLIFLAFLLPVSTFAEVTISEIMYAFEDADKGREWIEVYNNGATAVDIASWRLREAGSNHRLTLFKGDGVLPPGSYAIIADNPAKFLLDNTGFSGIIFDSLFSLRQKEGIGETLILRNSDLVDQDMVTYDPNIGANGDGNSLQKIGGVWIAASPTPGFAGSGSSSGSSVSSGSTVQSSTSNTQNSYNSGVVSLQSEKSITAYITMQGTATVVGAATLFEGSARGLEGEPLMGARYLWSFGDGAVQEGKNVLYTYEYPGEYIIVLDVSSGEYSATDRFRIEAVTVEIEVSLVGSTPQSFIEISNLSPHELSLGGWMLRSGTQFFIIPQNTLILPRTKIIFPSSITELKTSKLSEVALLYPNGLLAHMYDSTPQFVSVPLSVTSRVKEVPKGSFVTTRIVQDTTDEPSGNVKENEVNNSEITTQVASLASVEKSLLGDSRDKKKSSIFPWLTATFALIFLALFGLYAARSTRNLSDEFTIIEDDTLNKD